jgi:ribosomal protein S17
MAATGRIRKIILDEESKTYFEFNIKDKKFHLHSANIVLDGDNIEINATEKLSFNSTNDYEKRILSLEEKIKELEKKLNIFDFELIGEDKKDAL